MPQSLLKLDPGADSWRARVAYGVIYAVLKKMKDKRLTRRARNAQDLSILNARAARLDRETDDLLDVQSDPFE